MPDALRNMKLRMMLKSPVQRCHGLRWDVYAVFVVWLLPELSVVRFFVISFESLMCLLVVFCSELECSVLVVSGSDFCTVRVVG